MLGQVLARARLAEGSGELLLGQLRLHTKRVRALTATFRREAHRVPSLVGAELQDIDQNLDLVATQMTAALAAVDATFTAIFAGIAMLESLAATIDIEHPDRTPAERVAVRAAELLAELYAQHDSARIVLGNVEEQLIVSANKLAIVVGRPSTYATNPLRVLIRQMRMLSGITATFSSRLDVFMQNQSATLRALIPASRTSAEVAALIAGISPTAGNSASAVDKRTEPPAQEGAA
jgi:hypothetical protein